MASGIQPKFSRPGLEKRVGPYQRLRFEGERLRENPGGPEIARHVEHEWIADGERYPRLECDCRVKIHFERIDGSRSRMHGPFDSVSFIDGVAYADHEIFAFADRAIVDWYCHVDSLHWPLMVIEPCA